MASREAFVEKYLPYAQYYSSMTGIPPQVFLGIGASESNWGAAGSIFGIKGSSPSGKSKSYATWEWVNGERVPTTDTFATYDDPSEGFEHFIGLISSGRYSPAWKEFQRTGDWYGLLRGINNAGYATDPNWADSIADLSDSIVQNQGVSMPSRQESTGESMTTGTYSPEQKDWLAKLRERAGAGGESAPPGTDGALDDLLNGGKKKNPNELLDFMPGTNGKIALVGGKPVRWGIRVPAQPGKPGYSPTAPVYDWIPATTADITDAAKASTDPLGEAKLSQDAEQFAADMRYKYYQSGLSFAQSKEKMDQDARQFAAQHNLDVEQFAEKVKQFNATLQANREESEADRAFRTAEREATQSFASGEGAAERAWKTGESAADREFTTGERMGEERFKAGESAADREFATGERISGERFKAGESAADRAQRADEFARSQGFAEERAAAEQALANSRFRAEVLRNPSDYVARAFESRGGTSPETRFTHADALNGLRNLAPGGRFGPSAFEGDGNEIWAKRERDSGAGGVPKVEITRQPPLYESPPPVEITRLPTLSGFAAGGMTTASRFMVGDSVSGAPTGHEEIVNNPTNAPIEVTPTDTAESPADPFQQSEADFAAEIHAHKGLWSPEDWKVVEAKQKAIVVKKKRLENGESAIPKETMPRFAAGTGVPSYNPYGAVEITRQPPFTEAAPSATTNRPTYSVGPSIPGVTRFVPYTTNGPTYSAGPTYSPRPTYNDIDSRFTQAEIVARARRLSPPGVTSAIEGTRVPTYRPATSGLSLRKIGQLTPGEQEALNTRLGVEFNTTLADEIAGLKSRFGPVVSGPRARLVG